jgi:hypothetical protein
MSLPLFWLLSLKIPPPPPYSKFLSPFILTTDCHRVMGFYLSYLPVISAQIKYTNSFLSSQTFIMYAVGIFS